MQNKKRALSFVNETGLIEPGDELIARITKTGRKVIKMKKNQGMHKYSATQYSNGTIVETKTTKIK
ncbi:MAG: hypothetical protein K2F60_05030 [Oscillospiraceae bacterium]|nr:hypothetical protein [Oscillospiraceae bacterium]